MKPRHFVALFLALAFSLATVTSLYAAKSWVVIKDKKGVCKVIEAKEKTPATIDGEGPSRAKRKQKRPKTNCARKEPVQPWKRLRKKSSRGWEK